jgi:hypothetical protein
MRVTLTLSVDVCITGGEPTVKQIEQATLEAQRRRPSLVWQQVVGRVERRALSVQPEGGLVVKGWESRTLLTAAGPVEFRRRRFLCRAEQKSLLVFDLRVGLGRWERSTPGAERLLAESSAEAGYAAAARIWSAARGGRVNAMTCWRSVHKRGRAMRRGGKGGALRGGGGRQHVSCGLAGWPRA